MQKKLQLCSLGLCAGKDCGVHGCSRCAVQVVWEVLFLLLSLLHSTRFCFAGDQDLVWKLSTHGRQMRGEVGVKGGERMGHWASMSL